MSSRNLRNMTHVSMGNLSRSPLSPLSFRMMSRADLIREPNCWLLTIGRSGTIFSDLRIMRGSYPRESTITAMLRETKSGKGHSTYGLKGVPVFVNSQRSLHYMHQTVSQLPDQKAG